MGNPKLPFPRFPEIIPSAWAWEARLGPIQ